MESIEEIRKEKKRERSRDKEEEKEKQLDVFKKSEKKYISKGFTKVIETETDSSILNKYEKMNKTFLDNLNDSKLNQKYHSIMSNNMEITAKEKVKELGEQLFSLVSTLPKTKNKIVKKPNIYFNKYLSDEEFLNFVSEAKEYAFKTKTLEQMQIIINKFKNNKGNILELFNKTRIIKDILENAILSIFINEFSDNELDNNFNYLTIDDASPCPLINMYFNYNNTNYDLNKNNIINEASSYVPLSTFHLTMKEFCNNYNLKKKQLKKILEEYINNHYIYFASFRDDIQGITIHTGATYINLKYLREYFDENNSDKIIIIRTKILQIYFHELNHGLLREIDADKKINFFNNSKSKKQSKNYKLKTTIKGEYFLLPPDESGNYFDKLFYCGYYLDKLDMDISIFFLQIKEYKTKKDYFDNLLQRIINIKQNLKGNIFKFKKNYSRTFPQCAWSLMRRNNTENKEI